MNGPISLSSQKKKTLDWPLSNALFLRSNPRLELKYDCFFGTLKIPFRVLIPCWQIVSYPSGICYGEKEAGGGLVRPLRAPHSMWWCWCEIAQPLFDYSYVLVQLLGVEPPSHLDRSTLE